MSNVSTSAISIDDDRDDRDDRDGSDDRGATADDTVCCGGATTWIAHPDASALASRLGAVADPIRLQMLSIIANAPGGEVCACDFVGPLGKSQPTISHHLKVLAEAGLVDGDKRGRWVWYRLTPGHLDDLTTQLAELTAGRA